jgi:hypothetical protein
MAAIGRFQNLSQKISDDRMAAVAEHHKLPFAAVKEIGHRYATFASREKLKETLNFKDVIQRFQYPCITCKVKDPNPHHRNCLVGQFLGNVEAE